MYLAVITDCLRLAAVKHRCRCRIMCIAAASVLDFHSYCIEPFISPVYRLVIYIQLRLLIIYVHHLVLVDIEACVCKHFVMNIAADMPELAQCAFSRQC